MAKVVKFTAKSTKKGKGQNSSHIPTPFSFEEEVDKDINKLCATLGINKEEAIKMATNFYRTYPMLMEYVSSANHLLRGR